MECFLWEGMDDPQRTELMEQLSPIHTAVKGEQLYQQGRLGILLEGRATIRRLTRSGGNVTVRSIGEGEIFGAASMFGSWTGGSSIQATTGCKVCYITEEQLRHWMSHHPQIAFNYISYLTDRIRFLNRRIDAFSAGSSQQKLYEFLLSQTDQQGRVRLDFGMAELARRLKMGRSSVYRGLEQLQQAGLIGRDKNDFRII